jgi:hypothetical protein
MNYSTYQIGYSNLVGRLICYTCIGQDLCFEIAHACVSDSNTTFFPGGKKKKSYANQISWITSQYSDSAAMHTTVSGFQRTEVLRHSVVRLHVSVPHCYP